MASSSVAFHAASPSQQPFQVPSDDFLLSFPPNSPPPAPSPHTNPPPLSARYLRLPPPPYHNPPPPPHILPPPPPPRHLPPPPPPPYHNPPPPPHILPPPPPQPHPPFSPPLPPPPPPHHHTIIIIVVCVGGVFFLAFLLYLMCCFLRSRKRSKPQAPVCPSTETAEESIEQVTVVTFEERIEHMKPGGHDEIRAVSAEESESIRIQETVHEVNAAIQSTAATEHKTSEIRSEDETASAFKKEEGDLFDIQPFK